MWSPKCTPNFTPWLPVSAVLSPCPLTPHKHSTPQYLLQLLHSQGSYIHTNLRYWRLWKGPPAYSVYTLRWSILTLILTHHGPVNTHSNWSPSNNTPAFHKHSLNKAGDNWKQFYTFITDILFRFGPGNSIIKFMEFSTAFLLVSIIYFLLAYNCFTMLC